jgi:hypothetical protein
MTDIELADRIAKVHPSQDYFTCTEEERQQIIAALRRERPPSGEIVMVPREPTEHTLERMVEAYNLYQSPIDRGFAQQEAGMRLAYRTALSTAEGRKS